MANDSIGYTPGAGRNIAADNVGGVEFQVVKLDVGGAGASIPVVGTALNGILADVTRVQGVVVVNNPTAANLKVDASSVAVPVTDNGGSLTVDAPIAAPLGVRLSDGTNPITVLAVSGTLTGNQGTPAVIGNAWPVKITDGVNPVHLTNFAGNRALDVNVVGTVGAGAAADSSAFVDGATAFLIGGGVFEDAAASPTAGQAAAARITAKRALHVNVRDNTGNELGIAARPVQVQIGNGANPVHLTSVGGNYAADVAVTSFTSPFTNGAPLPATPAPSPTGNWMAHVAYTASQTAQAIRTPTAGKKSFIQGLVITPTGAGALTIYDSANGATSRLYNGTAAAGFPPIVIVYAAPLPLALADDILKYTSGAGATGDIVAWGYEL